VAISGELLIWYLGTAAALLVIGLYTLATKRNMIKLIIALEILVDAANLNLIIFAASGPTGVVDPIPQALVIISIGIGGCIAAIALALVVNAYRHYKTLDVRKLKKLRG